MSVPDEFVVRHFFRRGLVDRPGRVLELGCGEGSNLALYQAYGWRVTGVEADAAALEAARRRLGPEAELIQADIAKGLPELAGAFDALIVPELLCNLDRGRTEELLCALQPLLSHGCEVYVRTGHEAGPVTLLDTALGLAEHTEHAARFDDVQAPANSDLIVWGRAA